MFHSHSIQTLPFQPILPSPLELQNFTTLNESLMSVCRFGISFTYMIESTYFVYERAEFSSISLECTKMKLCKLNNFDINREKSNILIQCNENILYFGVDQYFFRLLSSIVHNKETKP